MIDIDTIEMEIRDLVARGDTTYSQCERLAWLFIVRDHLLAMAEDRKTRQMHGSEFMELASGVDYFRLMEVLDEYIGTIRQLYPKSYESLMDRIRSIR